ncbi:hypothetical protein ACOSP7_004180 [Xanthoceras sorbifolium]
MAELRFFFILFDEATTYEEEANINGTSGGREATTGATTAGQQKDQLTSRFRLRGDVKECDNSATQAAPSYIAGSVPYEARHS